MRNRILYGRELQDIRLRFVQTGRGVRRADDHRTDAGARFPGKKVVEKEKHWKRTWREVARAGGGQRKKRPGEEKRRENYHRREHEEKKFNRRSG